MKIKLHTVNGLDFACMAMRLSFDSKSKMEERVFSNGCELWADDVKLMSNLIMNGDSHAKAIRMADVFMEVTAPRYFWQEFDCYTQGVSKVSQSTVHTLTRRELEQSDFDGPIPTYYINHMNELVNEGDLINAKKCLPESFLQKRAMKVNYQALRHIYFDRRNHKLPEWHTFLSAMELLPFYEEFVKVEKKA